MNHVHPGAKALLCALLGFVTLVANAATPPSGTLSGSSRALAYSSGPFAVPNVSLNQDPNNPDCTEPLNPCDDFALTVDLPADYAATHPRDLITITSKWPINNDAFYIYLVDNGGNILASSISANDPNSLSVPAVAGTYIVRLAPSNAAGDTVATTVTLVAGPSAQASGAAPGFTALTPDPALGENTGGEMNIGFNPKTGRALTLGFLKTLRVSFPADAAPVWEDVSYDLTTQNTNDPILTTDPDTGRTFVSQLQAGTPGESVFAYTDDDGDNWTLSPSTMNGGIDHQTVGAGPYSASGTAGPAGDYPNAVYYCSQSVVAAFCVRSDDGSDTFGAPVTTKTAADCDGFLGGIHGHVKVARDGTVYVPDRNCGGVQAVIVSENSGASFTMKRLPETATAGNGDPSIGIATDGTAYFCYLAADSHVHVAVSHDRGASWVNDRDVGYAAGVVHAVFPAAVAGDPDRAACAFLGTATQGNYQSTDFQGIWFPYIAATYDGGNSWHTVNVSPGDPVQGTGGICLGGTTCIENRNLLDFNDATIDDRGRVLFGYDDGCVDNCLLPPYAPNQICIPTGVGEDFCLNASARTTIARQSTGRTLYSAYDAGGAEVPGELPSGSGGFLGAFGAPALIVLMLAGLAGALHRTRR